MDDVSNQVVFSLKPDLGIKTFDVAVFPRAGTGVGDDDEMALAVMFNVYSTRAPTRSCDPEAKASHVLSFSQIRCVTLYPTVLLHKLCCSTLTYF